MSYWQQHEQELEQQFLTKEIARKIRPVLTLTELDYLTYHYPRDRKGYLAMPKLSEMMPSKYLKKEDVPQPILVTIASIDQVNMKTMDGPDEKRWTMTFKEQEKPMVLNSTNLQLAALACGSDDTDDWIGKQIVLYTDPNVAFGGKVIGGLRLRPAKRAGPTPVKSAKAAPRPSDENTFTDMEDDIPF